MGKKLVEQKNKLKPDSSIYSLIIANILILVLAIIEDWSLGPLLIIYWWQSVIIGVFNFIKITRLKNFHTNHLKSRGKQLPANELTKMGMAFFFAFHYGIFHAGYLVLSRTSLSKAYFIIYLNCSSVACSQNLFSCCCVGFVISLFNISFFHLPQFSFFLK